MQRRLLVVLIFGLVVSFTCSSRAQQTDYWCCCNALCYYNFNIVGKYAQTEVFTMAFEDCQVEVDVFGLGKDRCEAPYYLVGFCMNHEEEARAELEPTVIGDLYNIWYYKSDGTCSWQEIECPIDYMLGAEDEALDILREFRDDVLSKSENGRRLIAAYYKYGDVLMHAFESNPAIEVFATEILEKTIERLLAEPSSDDELLTDELGAEIDILADELDAVVKSPGLKKTLRQIKGDIKRRKLF